jgi:hypothetical protein
MSLPGGEPPQPAAPAPGEATVTRLAPRLSTARHERPAPGWPAVSEPTPPPPAPTAPPVPSVSPVPPASPVPSAPATAEPRTDVSRPPAAERNSWPRPASREPAPAPLVAAESVRENHQAAPPPATETAAESPTGDPVPQAEPAAEQTGRQGRKAARGRRSSVPSWDEIMFGSSRQRD